VNWGEAGRSKAGANYLAGWGELGRGLWRSELSRRDEVNGSKRVLGIERDRLEKIFQKIAGGRTAVVLPIRVSWRAYE
jgi:hypothetical protein